MEIKTLCQIMYKSILKKGNTPKLRYNEHVRILLFTISRNSLYRDFVNSKGSWHLFTISQNSLYQDSLYRSLGYVLSQVKWNLEIHITKHIFYLFLSIFVKIDLHSMYTIIVQDLHKNRVKKNDSISSLCYAP